MINSPITNVAIPRILYKYRDADKECHLDLLRNSEIFMSSPEKFNDPFDCKIPINYQLLSNNKELALKFVEKVLSRNPSLISPLSKDEIINGIFSNRAIIDNSFLKQHQEEYLNNLNSDFGVLCLSKMPNNILLWSHYGNCHTGFCVGLNIQKLIECDTFGTIEPINYTNQYPNISPIDDPLKAIYTQLYYKSLHWKYEEEYRLVKVKGANKLVKLNPEVFAEIHLGCCMSTQKRNAIIEICKDNFPLMKIINWSKSKVKFELES